MDADRFSPDTRRICALAHSDALRLKHPSVGTEHLLSAIMGDGADNVAKSALQVLRVKPAEILEQLLKLEIPLSNAPPPLPLAKVAEEVFSHAIHLSHLFRHPRVLPEHILLAMLDHPCAGRAMLEAVGVDLLKLRNVLASMIAT